MSRAHAAVARTRACLLVQQQLSVRVCGGFPQGREQKGIERALQSFWSAVGGRITNTPPCISITAPKPVRRVLTLSAVVDVRRVLAAWQHRHGIAPIRFRLHVPAMRRNVRWRWADSWPAERSTCVRASELPLQRCLCVPCPAIRTARGQMRCTIQHAHGAVGYGVRLEIKATRPTMAASSV
jgi:hypothetical protein